MKHILLLLLAWCLLAPPLRAQDIATATTPTGPIAQGAKTFGGNLVAGLNPDVLQIRLGGGYFFTDRLALGLNLGANFLEEVNIYEVSPVLRYYIPIAPNTYLFGDARFSFLFDGFDNTILFGIGPGVAYFFNDRVAVEGSVNNLGGGGIGLFLLFP